MKTELFEYELDEKLIAQYPPKKRGTTRLMVVDRKTHDVTHKKYSDIPDYVQEGDVIVLNRTKVILARTFPKVERTGRTVEVFFMNKLQGASVASDLDASRYRGSDGGSGMEFWYCLIGRARHVKIGDKLILKNSVLHIVNREQDSPGFIIATQDAENLMKKYGHVPLPPYITRPDEESDKERYNTIFARDEGSVASPTASLNLTREILGRIKEKGGKIVYVNLVVGWGTFAPVTTDKVEDFKIHEEYLEIPAGTVAAVNSCKGRVWAVGTTVTRALESATVTQGKIKQFAGETDLFIYPGYKFKIVDVLVTNFHRSRSSLLMLVSAFVERDFLLSCYQQALDEGYKFLSYGDSMLII